MGTQILRPQDCLVERFGAHPPHFSHRRSSGNYCNYYYYNNNHVATSRSCRNPLTRPDLNKRLLPGSVQPRRSKSNADNAFEKVTILRRGQSLDSAVKSDVYAGSAFSVSPSPDTLPLPSFSTKKQASAAVDDSATRDLRRLLRLE